MEKATMLIAMQVWIWSLLGWESSWIAKFILIRSLDINFLTFWERCLLSEKTEHFYALIQQFTASLRVWDLENLFHKFYRTYFHWWLNLSQDILEALNISHWNKLTRIFNVMGAKTQFLPEFRAALQMQAKFIKKEFIQTPWPQRLNFLYEIYNEKKNQQEQKYRQHEQSQQRLQKTILKQKPFLWVTSSLCFLLFRCSDCLCAFEIMTFTWLFHELQRQKLYFCFL